MICIPAPDLHSSASCAGRCSEDEQRHRLAHQPQALQLLAAAETKSGSCWGGPPRAASWRRTCTPPPLGSPPGTAARPRAPASPAAAPTCRAGRSRCGAARRPGGTPWRRRRKRRRSSRRSHSSYPRSSPPCAGCGCSRPTRTSRSPADAPAAAAGGCPRTWMRRTGSSRRWSAPGPSWTARCRTASRRSTPPLRPARGRGGAALLGAASRTFPSRPRVLAHRALPRARARASRRRGRRFAAR